MASNKIPLVIYISEIYKRMKSIIEFLSAIPNLQTNCPLNHIPPKWPPYTRSKHHNNNHL